MKRYVRHASTERTLLSPRPCVIPILILLLLNLPVFSQTRTEFKLDTSPDAWLAPISMGAVLGAYALQQTAQPLTVQDLENLDASTIPAFDRWATEFSSLTVRTGSDVALGLSLAIPVLVLSEFHEDYIDLAGMYAETIALTWSITNVLKTSGRIRPLAYNRDALLSDRQSAEMRKSFPSGHTSISMAAMVFLATVYEGYRPGTTMSKVLWVGGIGLGLATASLRIFSGMHYPTDVLVGAVIGGVVGYVVPRLHEQKNISIGILPASRARPLLTIRLTF